MKLSISISDFAQKLHALVEGQSLTSVIQTISFDSRKILAPAGNVFFALDGAFRDGHDFLPDAYTKGIRDFVVSKRPDSNLFPNSRFFIVESPILALQNLAASHRKQFSYPVVGITGSVGKTTVKEWIYHLLSDQLAIVRSPKSYNSQLGVALSLLEMNERHELALIEAGISQANEMQALEAMIQPSFGLLTALGSAHSENFNSTREHQEEKWKLFTHCKHVLIPAPLSSVFPQAQPCNSAKYATYLSLSPFQDEASLQNLTLVLAFIEHLKIPLATLTEKIKTLPRLALRMETFEGQNGNTIINDSYSADLDALTQSLEYQKSIAGDQLRTVIIGVQGLSDVQVQKIKHKIKSYKLYQSFFINSDELPDLSRLHQQVILIKGTRQGHIERIANQFRLKRHQTRVEIDLSAIKNNLNFWRSKLDAKTKILVMVKAASYGSGAEKMGVFLEKNGVHYLGVAYADEGIELRNAGVKLPILVMNADEASFDALIEYRLEPAIYNFQLLDRFTKSLIDHHEENYPVHLKFDTGMRRLGFEPQEVNRILDFVAAQPELKIQSIYSHLAESDNLDDRSFTQQQIAVFKEISHQIEQRLPYPICKHILNSEGIVPFPEAQFDLVRIGIGLYGISVNPVVKQQLVPAIAWKSVVSQIKHIEAGETVGYGRSFKAEQAMQIAIIPVGYADGFKRSLGNGKGLVYIEGKACPVVGKVCMDMLMCDVSHLNVAQGQEVELLGEHQPIEQLAQAMDTIPYEVLTSLSKRLERIYIED